MVHAFDETLFDEDLQTATEELGNKQFTHSGTAYNAIISEAVDGKDLDLAGYAPDQNITIIVRTAVLGTRPVVGETLTHNSKTYRIKRVLTSADDKSLYMECEEETA